MAVCAALLAITSASAQERTEDFSDLAARAAKARDANDFASAIKLYKRALALHPDWAEGWWLAGSLQYDTEAYADGAESLRRLVILKPQAGPAWALLGLCDYETAEYGPALDGIERSLAIGVGDQPQMIAVLKFHEALLLTRRGEFDTAVQKYSGFIPPAISDQQLLLGLGLVAMRRAELPKEVPQGQTEFVSECGRAMAAFLTGNYAVAQSGVSQLLTRFPANADAHFVSGYFALGADPEGAIKEWERTLEIDPKHAAAHAMLSWIFWTRDEHEKALAQARAAIAIDQNSTLGQMVLGRLLVRKGQIDAGIGHLQRAAQAEPANLETHLALATAYSEAGRKLDSQRERMFSLKLQSDANAHP